MTTPTISSRSSSKSLKTSGHSKEDITQYISTTFQNIGADGVNVESQEWKQFRSEVYRLNNICSTLDQRKFEATQQHYNSQFCSDDVSRSSADSSIFLPQLGSKHDKIVKSTKGVNTSNSKRSYNIQARTSSLSKGRKPVQFGGV
jgi:hypothetical protein